MTKEQILTATGDELSRLAGEVFGRNHQPIQYSYYDDPSSTTIGCCYCSAKVSNKIRHKITDKQRAKFYSQRCPIPLTWPEAMKWRDWSVGEFGALAFRDALVKVCEADVGIPPNAGNNRLWCYAFMVIYAQPEHYIKAACLCKLAKESS